MDTSLAFLTVATVIGFYMAWNIGANDVSNAMGTSVGSGALTLGLAIVVATVFEFGGAMLVGGSVTETISKGVIDLDAIEHDEEVFVTGMIGCLLAAAVWLHVATFFGWPVSTTHAIIGALIGFGLTSGGVEAVNWPVMTRIFASWVISPVLGGVLAFFIFLTVRRIVLVAPDPLAALQKYGPWMVFPIGVILSLSMLYKGLKPLHLDLDTPRAIAVSLGVGLAFSMIMVPILRRSGRQAAWQDQEQKSSNGSDASESELQARAMSLRKQGKVAALDRSAEAEGETSLAGRGTAPGVQDTPPRPAGGATASETGVKDRVGNPYGMRGRARVAASPEEEADQAQEKSLRRVEKIFGLLQIVTACFVAFAHGSNDVANAIGPVAAVYSTIRWGITAEVAVPFNVLLLGAVGIVVGLATYGYKVMLTIGREITELTPSRGFAAEFAAATTIVVASKLGLPVSTTHVIVGAVIGVGFARSIGAINVRVIRNIVASWFITVPFAGILSSLAFGLLRFVFR